MAFTENRVLKRLLLTSGTFDRVWRQRLIMKFKAHGIYRNQVKTIKSFLDQRFLWVSIKEASQSISKQDRACSRVPCLNPTLFNIYIDDIIFEVESIPEVSTLLFADNFAIQGTSSNIEALEACLNCALSRVEKWASTNDMVINENRTPTLLTVFEVL